MTIGSHSGDPLVCEEIAVTVEEACDPALRDADSGYLLCKILDRLPCRSKVTLSEAYNVLYKFCVLLRAEVLLVDVLGRDICLNASCVTRQRCSVNIIIYLFIFFGKVGI